MDHLFAWVERLAAEGGDELRMQTGQTPSIRRGESEFPIMEEELDTMAIVAVLSFSGLSACIPESDSPGPPEEVTVSGWACKIAVVRRGDHMQVRIKLAQRDTSSSECRPAIEPTLSIPANDTREAFIVDGNQARGLEVEVDETSASDPTPCRHELPTVALPAVQAATRIEPGRVVLGKPTSIGGRVGEILRRARDERASDVHLSVGQSPMVRRVGDLVADGPPLTEAELEAATVGLLDAGRFAKLDGVGHVDFSVELEGVGRLRANVSRQRGGMKVCFRLVDDQPRTLDELGLPSELAKVVRYHQGLVVVSGPSGQGKTTTLASLVDLLNDAKADHIITVEDPIEVMHPRKRAVVSQREVGIHTQSFETALKGALREDPDVIVIGELRDQETVGMALQAAETGHLVLATMSTPNGSTTIGRLIDLFPPEDQAQVRSTLAGALKMVVSLRLVPSTDGTRRHAAAELITGNVPLWSLIRDNKLFQLPSLQQRGRGFGMIRVEESLRELLDAGHVDRETARQFSDDPKVFDEKPVGTPAGPGVDERPRLQGLVGNMFGRKS